MSLRRHALGLALLPLALASRPARADGVAVRLDLVTGSELKLDGIPREWPTALTPLAKSITGSGGGADLLARAAVAYDDANVYVAFDVNDDKLVRTASCAESEDHASLVLAFPTPSGAFAVHEIGLFAGDPGKTAGCVKAKGGGAVAGAKIVEAPKSVPGGYTFEAVVPWSAFPEASRTRVALRGALRFYDSDGGGIKTVIGTATDGPPAELPRFPGEAEQALDDGLLRDKGIVAGPLHDKIADVSGDGMYERVLVYDRWLVVLGPHFRDGKEYYFSDLGVDVAAGHLPSFEVKDLNGDGKSEIVMKKRVGSASEWREMFQALSMGQGDQPTPLFQHEIGISSPAGHVTNDVKLVADGAKQAIEILVGTASGYTAATYHEATETTMDPLLLPWGAIKSQTYAWNGSSFAKTKEEAQTERADKPAASAPKAGGEASLSSQPPPAPRPPSADELQDQVYALYRKERRVTGEEKPRFDFVIDVADDSRPERVLLHGRDLVVFGKGFRGGTGFAFLAMQQFADARDVSDVTARDLNGDGKAEIIIRGVVHARSAKEAEPAAPPKHPAKKGAHHDKHPEPEKAEQPAQPAVDREIVLVYQVGEKALTRVFAIETGRSVGDGRVEDTLTFVPGARGLDIAVQPGRAWGLSEKTYPFTQDSGPVGGLEPLLLPWSGASAARYHWDGSGFSR